MFQFQSQVNSMLGYAWADYVLFFIIFFNAIFGLARGLFKEITAFLCLVVALVIAARFTVPLTDWLSSSAGFEDVVSAFATFTTFNASTPLSYIALAVSFLLLLVGIYTTGEAVNFWASKRIIVFPIAFIDHVLGGALGFVRGVIFSLIVILIINLTPLHQDDGWSNAYLVRELTPKANSLGAYIRPGGFPTW